VQIEWPKNNHSCTQGQAELTQFTTALFVSCLVPQLACKLASKGTIVDHSRSGGSVLVVDHRNSFGIQMLCD
jgi:hypothetical protein